MLLEVGRVEKAHGLRGEVIVKLSTNVVERVAPGSVLFAGDRALTVVSSSPHQHRFIVQFEGVASREEADALHGAALQAEPIDDPEALWIHELIGAEVFDLGGVSHGTVRSVIDNPASDLLELESGVLIPLRFVVDHAMKGKLVVDPPAGLLEGE